MKKLLIKMKKQLKKYRYVYVGVLALVILCSGITYYNNRHSHTGKLASKTETSSYKESNHLTSGAAEYKNEQENTSSKSYVITKESDDYVKDNQKIQELLTQSKGFIEQSTIYTNTDRLGVACYTVRVPKAEKDTFIKKLNQIGNTISEEIQMSDFRDLLLENTSKKKALETEETALLKLLEKSETIEDMLKIQERLSNIRSKIDLIKATNAEKQNEIDYLAITIYMNEQVQVEIKAPEKRVIDKVTESYQKQAKFWSHLLSVLLVYVISGLPYLIFLLLIIVLLKKYLTKKEKTRLSAR